MPPRFPFCALKKYYGKVFFLPCFFLYIAEWQIQFHHFHPADISFLFFYWSVYLCIENKIRVQVHGKSVKWIFLTPALLLCGIMDVKAVQLLIKVKKFKIKISFLFLLVYVFQSSKYALKKLHNLKKSTWLSSGTHDKLFYCPSFLLIEVK
jgi:hypothetical protein